MLILWESLNHAFLWSLSTLWYNKTWVLHDTCIYTCMSREYMLAPCIEWGKLSREQTFTNWNTGSDYCRKLKSIIIIGKCGMSKIFVKKTFKAGTQITQFVIYSFSKVSCSMVMCNYVYNIISVSLHKPKQKFIYKCTY